MSDTKRELFDKLRYELHMADMLATEINHSRGMSNENVSHLERHASKAAALAFVLKGEMAKKQASVTIVPVPATSPALPA